MRLVGFESSTINERVDTAFSVVRVHFGSSCKLTPCIRWLRQVLLAVTLQDCCFWLWHHITSHHIVSHQIKSHHVTSHHIKSRHIPSHPVISPHILHITSHYITSHHITWFQAVSNCFLDSIDNIPVIVVKFYKHNKRYVSVLVKHV